MQSYKWAKVVADGGQWLRDTSSVARVSEQQDGHIVWTSEDRTVPERGNAVLMYRGCW